MTVGELRALLETYDQSMPVFTYSFDGGDDLLDKEDLVFRDCWRTENGSLTALEAHTRLINGTKLGKALVFLSY